MNRRTLLGLIGASLLFAVLAHAFFFYQLNNGQFMVGPNDGTAQMLPFKQFLYQQFSEGSFFYSHQFGLGGGIFSQLAYYFSTSSIFFLTFIIVYLGEWFGIFLHTDEIIFWGQAAVFVNTARLAIVVFITTLVFRYFKIPTIYAFIGAILYGGSVMYFRHASFWEFFADAYLWLPLLVLGVEKIIREKKPGWFIAAIALSIINNFYFAYMNFLFIGIYALIRFFIRFSKQELTIKKQISYYIPAVLLGFFIGAFAFVPSVYGYLNNFRPSFSDPIPWFDLHDDFLFTSRVLIVPALFFLLAFSKKLYQFKPFLFFSIVSGLFLIFHYSPMIGSIFNGFSAPQYRFQYMASFALAGAISFGLSKLHTIPKRNLLWSALVTSILLIGSYSIGIWSNPSAYMTGTAIFLLVLGLLSIVVVLVPRRMSWSPFLVLATLVVFQLGLANLYQKERLFEDGNLHQTSTDFLQSHQYDHPEQRDLLEEVNLEEPLSRIEWVADFRNNTPLVQNFPGVSAYSSVLNQQLLFFYYHDLQIDMNRESVSRYSGFGDRANLHSLFRVSHKLVQNEETDPIPYGFTEVDSNDAYTLYENQNLLSYARTTNSIYSQEELETFSVLEREHAMLQGAVARDSLHNTTFESTVTNRLENLPIEAVGGTYENGILTVEEEFGGIDIFVGERTETEVDDYFSFYLLNNSATARLFPLTVNEFETNRKSLQSIYRTDVNQITVRIASDEIISLRVPEGSYTLDHLELYTESYATLDREVTLDEPIPVERTNNNVSISYNNTSEQKLLTIPVPYERGWEVTVNGQNADIERVNYSFLGVQLAEGKNEITFTYFPPFFKQSLSLSIVGLLLATGWYFARRRFNT
ncbi:putative membrane protein YfhO [Alkalihalobacillus xiaoxiensis]|uniref:Membrane protein YfhO n=1 Tax=Shouchella xiaoxiensis TaxID=766895 RepID=A0ABS2T112_9BACI|nr:YfhO family protein [Shouchella xiaoxiensis]MBM7841141.1 putative membrane protein YfhO [Shouchella xiaoxiensis]